jgi:hypothetical protein
MCAVTMTHEHYLHRFVIFRLNAINASHMERYNLHTEDLALGNFCKKATFLGIPECSVPLMGPVVPSPYHHRSRRMSRLNQWLVEFWICLCHSNPLNHCTSTKSKAVSTREASQSVLSRQNVSNIHGIL